jgi:conjugative transfer signal peptidase TraF
MTAPARRIVLTVAAASATALAVAAFAPPEQGVFLWNRTQSAPKGLYWRGDGALETGDWAIVSARAPAAVWTAEHGFLAPEWPLIKRVAGVPGDEICREDERVFINGALAAVALRTDFTGRKLPSWSGCKRLEDGEFFLLNDHPRSLDGRYFGATKAEDIGGKARLLWSVKR